MQLYNLKYYPRMTMTNPLLLQNPIEKIDQIDPNHVVPAIEAIISENKKAIKELITQKNITWQNLMLPLEVLENQLSKAWSPVSHLNSVCNNDELSEAYNQALALLTEYSTELGQHKGLFDAMLRLFEDKEAQCLSTSQCQILKDSLIGFKLSGLHLENEEQKEFANIQKRLAELKTTFEQNILDATMSWTKNITNQADLSGLPKTELAMLAANAESRDQQGHTITLEIPSYLAIMTYADNRELRQEVYTAYTTRASAIGPDNGKFDNSQVMVELLALKHQKAQLLGFNNYAELSTETKMAESPGEVIEFLQQLNSASHTQAVNEFNELKDFANLQGVNDLQAWDLSYYSEKLKQQNYQVSQSQLRPYFPVEKVINGMFKLTQHHFEVSFSTIETSATWHKDVRHFAIKRNDETIAEFYLDLYARSHKRGGAWMADYQGRFKQDNGKIQHPIAYLTCNFAPPVNNQPALLTHDEVVTLFHEFGHGIHHMLTQVNELSASGIANVPWDAVELPSQFMENFCYQPEVIETLSEHFETKAPLPKLLLDKLIAAKNFQSAMMMVRQLEFSIFDMKIHMSKPLDADGIQQVLDQTREQVAVVIPPKFNQFQHGFSHIFAGGYSAGYYSYKWAEVLSADAFSLFEELGVMNKAAGKKFRENILEKGGSQEPMELFVAFRGRKPDVSALLKHSGIKTAA